MVNLDCIMVDVVFDVVGALENADDMVVKKLFWSVVVVFVKYVVGLVIAEA